MSGSELTSALRKGAADTGHWFTVLREKLNGLQRPRIILIAGLCGAALLILPGILPEKRAQPPPADGTVQAEQYRESLERRLTDLLNGMEGVGQVQVMITVSGTAEQIYASEVKASQNERARQQEAALVITRSSGAEAPVIAKTVCPAVLGAAVLCSGGDHAAVQERVRKAASSVLGIPQGQIFVGKSAT